MNKNPGTQNTDRRRDVRTPAQRKAEQERKLMQQKRLQEKSAVVNSPQAKQTNAENTHVRHNITSASPAAANTKRIPQASKNSATVNNPPRTNKNSEYERQLLAQQKQIEMLQRQINAEKEQRKREEAGKAKIRELERNIRQQKLLQEKYIDAETKGYYGANNGEMSKSLRIVALAIIAVLLIITVITCSRITIKTVPSKPTSAPEITGTAGSGTVSEQGVVSDQPAVDVNKEKISVSSSDYAGGTLMLVNSDYFYNFDYSGSDIPKDTLVAVAGKITDKSYKAADYNILLNTETVNMLNLMMTDFNAYSGKTDVMVNSAHRTKEQQQQILDSKIQQLGEDQQIAQTPGNSEHHTGYAFDFSIYPANSGRQILRARSGR